jgi:hypothetical protein
VQEKRELASSRCSRDRLDDRLLIGAAATVAGFEVLIRRAHLLLGDNLVFSQEWPSNDYRLPLTKLIGTIAAQGVFYLLAVALHSDRNWRGTRTSRTILLATGVCCTALLTPDLRASILIEGLPLALAAFWVGQYFTGK